MFLGNFVIYTVFSNIILLVFKKTQSLKIQNKFLSIFCILLILLLSYDIKTSYESDNYYKFFKIKRNFTKKDLQKGKRDLMKKCHPDNIDEDSKNNNCFYLAQELFEIFELKDKKNKNLIKAYNNFPINIHKIYFSKYESKDYNVYDKQYFDNLNIEYYIIIFVQLFILKEIKNSNVFLKIISGFFIGLCYLLEIVYYGYYDVKIKGDFLITFFDSFTFFDYLTYFQIIFLIKRILFGLLFVYLMFYILNRQKTVNFLTVLENLEKKLKNNKLESKDFKEEEKLIEKKIKKENNILKSRNKVYTIFVVSSIVYVLMIYYGGY